MADIASLLANAAQTNANFDFGSLNKSYWGGLEEAYKQRTRDAFQDPSLYVNGQLDPAKALQQTFRMGGIQAVPAAKDLAEIGFQQQRYGNAPGAEALISGQFPKSLNRGASATEPAVPTAGGDGTAMPATLKSILVAQDIPNNQLNAVNDSISAELQRNNIDPNGPLDLSDGSKTRNIIGSAVAQLKRMGIGQVYGQGQATPAPQPISYPQNAQSPESQVMQPSGPQVAQAGPPQQTPIIPTPVQTVPIRPTIPQPSTATDISAQRRGPDQLADPGLRGLVPPGVSPEQYLSYLQAAAARPQLPEITKALHDKIAAIQTALQPTETIKNYNLYRDQQQILGEKIIPFEEWRQQDQEQQTQRAILTTSILPKLDKSQEAAIGLKDSINAIHRARTQLDAPGGIFSGSTSSIQLKLAKVASIVGVANADKITNTEAYGSAIGERVLSLVKGLGSGTAISNADREYAAGMAGGNIALNETSMRRILDIGEQAARARITAHNSLVDSSIGSNESLKGQGPVFKVEAPGVYKKSLALPKEGDFATNPTTKQRIQLKNGQWVPVR